MNKSRLNEQDIETLFTQQNEQYQHQKMQTDIIKKVVLKHRLRYFRKTLLSAFALISLTTCLLSIEITTSVVTNFMSEFTLNQDTFLLTIIVILASTCAITVVIKE